MRIACLLCFLASTVFSQSTQEHLAKARSAICDKSYQTARTALESALAQQPGNLEAQLLYVSTLCYQKKQADAKQYSAQKASSEAATLLDAQVALFARDVATARRLLDGRRQTHDDYLTRYLLGYTLVVERKPDEALTHLKRAYEMNPSHPETLFLLGDLYRAKDQVSEVALYWSKYLEFMPPGNNCTNYVHDYLKRVGGQ